MSALMRDTPRFSVPTSPSRASAWTLLPNEVRQIILEFLALSNFRIRRNEVPSLKLARFATVCLEWQAFFEACIFRRLVVDTDSLEEFDEIIEKNDARLGYIRKLWLRVTLPSYDCPACDEAEDKSTQHSNNVAFTRSIQSLLDTLKLWDPAKHGRQGLELMLSASSPSDTQHRFEQCEIKVGYPFQYAEDLEYTPAVDDFHRKNAANPFNHLFHRYSSRLLHNEHVQRLRGTPLRLEQRGCRGLFKSSYKSLPAVPLVKGLVMRRHFRRDVHIQTLSWLLSQSFVALEWLHIEKTVFSEPCKQLRFDEAFQQKLLPALPQTLRRFSFTQWEIPQKQIDSDFEAFEFEPALPVLSAMTNSLRELARLAQRLEQFCPPWQVDTAAFLQCLIELNNTSCTTESYLKRMILRCLLLSTNTARETFESMVVLAAKAAMSLPKLEAIELWGTCIDEDESCAYAFRYCHDNGSSSIVCRSSGEAMVSKPLIIAKWTKVAEKHTHTNLDSSFLPFLETSKNIYKTEGACIHRHLLLKDLLCDPVTRMVQEQEARDWRSALQPYNFVSPSPAYSTFPHSAALSGDLLTDILGSDDDMASLQADIMAYEAGVRSFLHQNGD